MHYTQNPELDAAHRDDEADAYASFMELASVEAPKIVLNRLRKLTKPFEWLDDGRFYAGSSAAGIQMDAIGVDDDSCDAYAEFMVNPTPEAKDKLLTAMATWFAKTYAYEIYKEYCDDLAS